MNKMRYLIALLMVALTIAISHYSHSLIAWLLMMILSGYYWGQQFKQWSPLWLLSTLLLMLAVFHFTTEENARSIGYYFMFFVLSCPALIASSYGAMYKKDDSTD